MRLFPRLFLAFGMAVTCLSSAGAAQRVALVIGNSDYALISPLANPKNDAALMAATLRDLDFEVIEQTNADQKTMKRAIRDFGKRLRRAGPEVVGLFYYAGHGVQAGRHNYLIPLGAPVEDEADLEIETVSAAWVLGQMESAGNGLNIVILDACRSNPFKGSFRSSMRGLARMDAPTGSLVAYSAAPGQVAADGRGRNSPYTAALARAMREPGLDLLKVFQRTRLAVQTATAGLQTPWEEQSLLGDFYFVPQGSTVTVTPPGASPAFDARALELALWEAVKDSADPADFEDYLAQYPSGVFSGPAKRRLVALTEVAALPPATAATPGYEIEEIDETYYVLKRANVRSGPGTSFEKVGRLSLGDEVGVTGKVLGKRWLRIALEGGDDAYVYGPLLSAEKPKPPVPVVVEEKPKPANDQVAVGVYPKAGRQPGDTFKDCPECPEMVVVPAGSFMMGSPVSEEGRSKDESPQHRVTISKPLAVGKYEVTFNEWDACVAAGGCRRYRPNDAGWGRGNRPVINVSWKYAQSYVSWLGRKTGKRYRLLSEAEWEYAARAGTTTPFNTGRTITTDQANFDGNYTYGGSVKGEDRQKTLPVGSFPANGFGLHDAHGNVWEWVEDCWHKNYAGAPTDERAWTSGDGCSRQVRRGGSWSGYPRDLRSGDRYWGRTGSRVSSGGFRVARTL